MKKSIESFKKFAINPENVKGGGYYCWDNNSSNDACVDGEGPVIHPSTWSCIHITMACKDIPTVTP